MLDSLSEEFLTFPYDNSTIGFQCYVWRFARVFPDWITGMPVIRVRRLTVHDTAKDGLRPEFAE